MSRFTGASMAVFCVGAAHADLGDELAKLLSNDGLAGDSFGQSVGIHGTTGIVGAPGADNAAADSGSAYLFNTITGGQFFELLPNDGAAGDRFGHSVGVSGTTAIVGSILDDDSGANSGSAYLFSTITGMQTFKLTSNDGAGEDRFGASVAISGRTAVVGQPGMPFGANDPGYAYLFDTVTGMQTFKLIGSDAMVSDTFGNAVGISGTTAIVGARFRDLTGGEIGAAYLFDIGTGLELFKLTSNDGASGDEFGASVAIHGTTAIVGAPGDDDNGAVSGSAYLFDVTTGQQLFKLLANDGAFADGFGVSVSISGTIAIVGTSGDDDNGTSSGSAYLFDIATGQQLIKLLASDGAAGDGFGPGIAICGTTALVGASLDDDNGLDSGSAYLIEAGGEAVCLGDINGDGMVDAADLGIMLGNFGFVCP